MKRLFLIGIATLALVGLSQAEPQTSVTRTSPNHTKIVIHDTSPQATRSRDAQVEEARKQRERQKEREHELELARIRAGQSASDSKATVLTRQVATNNDILPSIEERRKQQAEANKPSAFMNGGQWTGGFYGFGFGGFGFPGYGYGYGPAYGPAFGPAYGPGFAQPCRPVYRPSARHCRR